MILAGDIGGTKTNLGLFEPAADRPRKLRGRSFPSREFPGLSEILEIFLAGGSDEIQAACFGIAGPVRAGRVETANLPWTIAAADVATEFAIPRVELVNDLVAMAAGIPALDPPQFSELQAGAADPTGNAALVAAGTGFGVAILAAQAADWLALPSEGGHCDFAPGNEEEVDLWRTLRRRHGHVNVENVVSGPGLVNIYEHLRDSGAGTETPELTSALAEADAAPVIAAWGASGRSALCAKALAMFLRAYGAAAGNVALMGLATRGVYLGGGIAPKLLAQLQQGGFMAGFLDKGRYRALMETIPVSVILEPETALWGAAIRASAGLAGGA